MNCHITCFGPLEFFFFFNYICDKDVSTEKNITEVQGNGEMEWSLLECGGHIQGLH